MMHGIGAAIATVGMFDGVHKGHLLILSTLQREACRRELSPVVLTFEEHPLSILRPKAAPKLLTDINTRIELIRKHIPTAQIIALRYCKSDFAADADTFLRKIHNDYGVEALVMGFNNTIGSDRRDAASLTGNAYIEIAATVPPILIGGEAVSSSRVRKALIDGNINLCNDLLGRPYTIAGTVTSGKQLGRTIGFPTANILLDNDLQLLPGDGVYVADAHLPDGSVRRADRKSVV